MTIDPTPESNIKPEEREAMRVLTDAAKRRHGTVENTMHAYGHLTEHQSSFVGCAIVPCAEEGTVHTSAGPFPYCPRHADYFKGMDVLEAERAAGTDEHLAWMLADAGVQVDATVTESELSANTKLAKGVFTLGTERNALLDEREALRVRVAELEAELELANVGLAGLPGLEGEAQAEFAGRTKAEARVAELEAEIERMRPVVDAAVNYENGVRDDLTEAVDAYLIPKEPTDANR